MPPAGLILNTNNAAFSRELAAYIEFRKQMRPILTEAISPALAGVFGCEYHITKGWDRQEKRWTGKMFLLVSPFSGHQSRLGS